MKHARKLPTKQWCLSVGWLYFRKRMCQFLVHRFHAHRFLRITRNLEIFFSWSVSGWFIIHLWPVKLKLLKCWELFPSNCLNFCIPMCHLFSCLNFMLVYFFLSVMNGEKAAYGSPTFSNRRQRTLDSLITRLLQDHMHEVRTGYEWAWSSSTGNL